MLESIRVHPEAKIGEYARTDEFHSWASIVSRAKDLVNYLPKCSVPRAAYGITAPNGTSTLMQIFSVLESGGIPVPFPYGTSEKVIRNCLGHLSARALWDEKGWHILGKGRQLPEGFDLIMHSSGSSGVPKPLAIRFEAMRRNAFDVADALQLGPDDIHLGTMSQCYMSGLYNAVMLPLFLGSQSISSPVITPNRLNDLISTLILHRPTVLWLNPLIARMMTKLRAFDKSVLSSVRFAISCTAPLSPIVKSEFEAHCGIPILQSYGLSETLITTVERLEKPQPTSSVGKPVGRIGSVKIDTDGQIVVSNGAHFSGYIKPDDENDFSPIDPYETGDIGYIDSSGNLFVTGRVSETININGIKVSPEEIESVLNSVSGVSDSGVLGVEDGFGQVRLVALIVGNDSCLDLLTIENLVELPLVKRPKYIKTVSNIPRTANGKIDRPALMEAYKKCTI